MNMRVSSNSELEFVNTDDDDEHDDYDCHDGHDHDQASLKIMLVISRLMIMPYFFKR